MSRVEAALAEIARQVDGEARALAHLDDRVQRSRKPITPPNVAQRKHILWALDVLRGDREVLERHGDLHSCYRGNWWVGKNDIYKGGLAQRGYCPDAARVLDRYAPEATP